MNLCFVLLCQVKPSHADLSQAMSALNLPWSWPSRACPTSKRAAGDISQLQPTRNKHPSPPQINTQLMSVQETWEKAVFIILCVQLSVILWLLTESFKFLSSYLCFWTFLFHCVFFLLCLESCFVTAGENTMFPVMLWQNKSFEVAFIVKNL